MVLEAIATMGLYLYAVWHHRREEFWIMAATVAMPGHAAAGRTGGAAQPARPRCACTCRTSRCRVAFIVLSTRQLRLAQPPLQDAEAARNSLESRVAEATAEMERNYAQMAELRVEQVTEKERKRIAGDLHDDLGAKLLTIVHTSESERISDAGARGARGDAPVGARASPASRCRSPTPWPTGAPRRCCAWARPASRPTGAARTRISRSSCRRSKLSKRLKPCAARVRLISVSIVLKLRCIC